MSDMHIYEKLPNTRIRYAFEFFKKVIKQFFSILRKTDLLSICEIREIIFINKKSLLSI